MTDSDKLARLLLRVVHKITMCPGSSRTKWHAEAGYLLKDIDWPEIDHKLVTSEYEYPERLDTRGFDPHAHYGDEK